MSSEQIKHTNSTCLSAVSSFVKGHCSLKRLTTATATVIACLYYLIPYGIDTWQYRSAIHAEQNGNIDIAKLRLSSILQRWPDDPRVRLLSARVGWRSRLQEPFPEGWEQQVRGDIKAVEAYPHMLLDAALESDTLDTLTGNNRSSERRLAARTSNSHARAVQTLEALVRGNLETHRFDVARFYAEELIRRKPDSALARFWCGLALELSGHIHGEAEPYYRMAVNNETHNTTYQVALVRSLIPHKAYLAELRTLIDNWLKADPQRSDLLPYYAEILIDLGDTVTAKAVIDHLASTSVLSSELYLLRGRIEMTDNQLDNAELAFREALKLAPKHYAAHNYLAQCLTLSGKTDEAKVQRDVADRISADHELIAKKAKLAKAAPSNPRLRYELGILNLRSGDDRVGVYWLESALAIDPDFTPAREALAAHFKAAHPR